MPLLQQKPIVHGRDHAPNGPDPIPGLGGGIAFDTYPQDGQWLYVETDGTDTSPSGFGMEFFDTSGNGIDLASNAGGGITLRATGGGGISISTTGSFLAGPLSQSSGGVTGLSGQGVTIQNNDSTASAKIISASNGYYVRIDDTSISLGSTSWGADFLTVFRVGPTIEYHILSGATWVADL